MSVQYHNFNYCNKCGGLNKVKETVVENAICEAETKCTECGFEDYWAYGFFESSQDGYDACKKYGSSQ